MKRWLFAGLGLAGFVVFVLLYEQTFPTASLDLALDRTQARTKAAAYVSSLGFDLTGYTSSVVFDGNEQKFVFLEKCLGLARANELTRKDIPVWYWHVRFFKELEKEGFEVQVNPNGRVDGFTYLVEEHAPGETVSQDDARTRAEAFLATQAIDVSEARGAYELIEASTVEREHRSDHHFTWKKKKSEIEWREGREPVSGMMRVAVDVIGSRIGAFQSYFWTPELFGRYLQKLFSEGRFLALICSFLYFLLYVSGLVMFIVSFRVAPISYRIMLVLALLIGAPHLLNLVNSIPLITAGYETQMTMGVYYGSTVIGELRGILNAMVIIIITGCAGLFCAASWKPERIASLKGLLEVAPRTREARRELVGGYALAGMVLGYVTLFYVCGMKWWGVWVFPTTNYSNILATWCPFLMPLTLSISAAVSEEFVFRMFAIPFLKKVVRLTVLAVLIPSVIWAFAHSSYAVFPIYTRGIELTIVACAFGYVFLRYGILTCIVAHYVIDAVLFSIPLLRSSNGYFLMSGIIVILLALVPAAVSLRKSKL